LLETYEKLGIPLRERERLAGVALDAVFEQRVGRPPRSRSSLPRRASSSARSARRCRSIPIWSGNISAWSCPTPTNFFATLNSAVFTDGSFCYIPKGVRCPMELSTYFRINAANTGQFERTLIVADEGSHVSYLEGCTAPMRR